MDINEELDKIKELTGTESISDSLELLHNEAIKRLESMKEQYSILDLYKKYFLLMHPVGDIYISTSETNPGDIYGGEWEPYAQGRVLVGVNELDYEYRQADVKGGNYSINHTHLLFNHMHDLSHSHDNFESHTHDFNHHHDLVDHAHIIEHKHKLPSHNHTVETHYHTTIQSNINGESIKICKPMNGQIDYPSYKSTYWMMDKNKNKLSESDNTSGNNIEYTENNKEDLSSYANINTTSNSINTLYSNSDLIYYENKSYNDSPIDANGNIVHKIKETEVWSGTCSMEHQLLDGVITSTVQPYVTCYIFKRIS